MLELLLRLNLEAVLVSQYAISLIFMSKITGTSPSFFQFYRFPQTIRGTVTRSIAVTRTTKATETVKKNEVARVSRGFA